MKLPAPRLRGALLATVLVVSAALVLALALVPAPAADATVVDPGFGLCPSTNPAGCGLTDIVCNSYLCCCVYGGAGCSAPSTGPCWKISPF